MSLCNSVSKIASELESQLIDITVCEQNRLNILKEMPVYLRKGRLDLFDKDYKDSYYNDEIDKGFNFDMIELVSELAYENLYVGYSINDSVRTYTAIVKHLKINGIIITNGLDVSKW